MLTKNEHELIEEHTRPLGQSGFSGDVVAVVINATARTFWEN